MLDRKLQVCYHEAGHTVMAIACGLKVTKVTCIENIEENSSGRTSLDVDAFPKALFDIYKHALVSTAGLAGSMIYHIEHNPNIKDDDEVDEGIYGDLEKTKYILRRAHPESSEDVITIMYKTIIGYSSRVLERLPYLGFIRELANELYHETVLNEDKIANYYDRIPKLDTIEFENIMLMIQIQYNELIKNQ